jgi:hypothetical protein
MRSRLRRRIDRAGLPMDRPSRGVHGPPRRPHAARRPPMMATAPAAHPPPGERLAPLACAASPDSQPGGSAALRSPACLSRRGVRVSVLALQPAAPASAAARGAPGSTPASAALWPGDHPGPPRPERLRAKRPRPPAAGPERGFSATKGKRLRKLAPSSAAAVVPAGTGQPLRGTPRAGLRRHAACILRCPRMAILRPGPRPPRLRARALT